MSPEEVSAARETNHRERAAAFRSAYRRVSSPGELHPEALAETDVNLSAHPCANGVNL
jgi:hypothetical protein